MVGMAISIPGCSYVTYKLLDSLFGLLQVSTYGTVCGACGKGKWFASGHTMGGIQIRIKTWLIYMSVFLF